ncbi:helix-turn-helix domain-containing protein [Dyadobacter sp. CY261]|uniref:helix-turn-helix domain-containing protein n=1 Tax=Dyadobacter sp. CY261 TaxID=2907203 RepID=UPI001F2A5A0C|nr:helix-turn-helix domain-containing protein [Dyadobacter sp. CY261]MCF0074223.1 helix-turn-helix domain-containing protein [Dyadobacter sp. CY261]
MKQENGIYSDQRIAVPVEFADFFTHFYAAQNNSEQDVKKTLIPSFQTIIVFSFGPSIKFKSCGNSLELNECVILGPIRQVIEYTLPPGAHLLIANFKDDAFYRFFGPAVLSDQMAVHPDELLDENCFTRLWLRLKNESTTNRIALILDFCRPYLRPRHLSVTRFTEEKADYTVVNPIKTVAQKTGQSERNVQLNHKKYFGFTAKEKARYEKFSKALQLLQTSSGKIDWHQIAETCGYYDQSQLIRDFNHYLNLSPGRYIKFQKDICKAGG